MTKIISVISFFFKFLPVLLIINEAFQQLRLRRQTRHLHTHTSLCVTLSRVSTLSAATTGPNEASSFPNWCLLIINLAAVDFILLTEFCSHGAVVSLLIFTPYVSNTTANTWRREQRGDWPNQQWRVETLTASATGAFSRFFEYKLLLWRGKTGAALFLVFLSTLSVITCEDERLWREMLFI